MKAESTSWKNTAFDEGVEIPLNLDINAHEIERFKNGLIPTEMEDKWFIYFEEPYL